eukprot:ANDGO_06989.mRNA.1 Protein tipD
MSLIVDLHRTLVEQQSSTQQLTLLCDQYNDVLRMMARDRETCFQLKSDLARATEENSRLRKTVLHLEKNSSGTGPESSELLQSAQAKIKELDDKVRAQAEELTTLLRYKALSSADMLDLSKENKQQAKIIEDQTASISVLQSQLSESAASRGRLENALEVMRREYEALQKQVESKDKELRDQSILLSRLQEKMVSSVQTHADMLNDANNENEALRREIKKLQSQLAEAMKRLADGSFVDVSSDVVGSPSSASAGSGAHGKESNSYLSRVGLSNDTSAARKMLSHAPSEVYKRVEGAHDTELNGVAMVSEGVMPTLATVSSGKTVLLWEARTFTPTGPLSGSTQALLAVDLTSPALSIQPMVLAAGNDATCRVWTLGVNRLRHALTGHTAKIHGARFNADARFIITGSHDRTLKLWDVGTGYCIRTIPCGSSCNDVCFGPTGDDIVVSGHLDGSVRVFDARDARVVGELKGLHSQQVTSVAVARDGMRVLTNGRDSVLRLVDIRMQSQQSELMAFRHADFKSGVNWNRACMSPDGMYVAAGGLNGRLFVWNTGTAKLECSLEGHEKPISSVIWSSDGQQLVSVGLDGALVVWR